MRKKLAIIGANVGQKPLVLKAKEMGIETHCFAWNKGNDIICSKLADYFHPISTNDKEQILEVCQQLQIDGIISISNDSYVPTVCYVAGKMGLTGNGYEDSLISTNKLRQREAFLKNGVNSPRFVVAGEKSDYSLLTYPLIVKPTDRGGSTGVMKVEKEEDLKVAVEHAKKWSFTGEVIVEEYVSGAEATVDMISWKGTHYEIVVTDTETLGGPYFMKTGYHQPTRFCDDIRDKIIAEAKKAITALNIKYGASDIEVKVTEEGVVKIVEVNPRMGGDCTDTLLRLSTGYDYLKAVINVALNQFEKPVFSLNKYSGICFLSKETEHLKKIIENRKDDPDIVTAEIYNDELRYLQTVDERSGYFIYQSNQRRNWERINQLK